MKQAPRYRVGTLGIVLCVQAVPAAALVPNPICGYDPATDRYIESGATIEDRHIEVEVSALANSFALGWVISDNGDTRAILQHCPTRQELLLAFPQTNRDTLIERFNGLIYGETEHTMRQMAEDLAPYGVGARMTTDTYGACACDSLFGAE